MVLEFDTAEPPFSAIGKYILPVDYSEKKPDYVHWNREQDFQNELFTVATTKAAAWKYEQEIRIIIVASRTALRETRYLPVTSGSITGVYLGCRISAIDRVAIRTALNRAHFQHVCLRQAELDQAEYALTLEDIR